MSDDRVMVITSDREGNLLSIESMSAADADDVMKIASLLTETITKMGAE